MSIIVIGGSTLYAITNWSVFIAMEPNAWGDFLAGTAGSVAFIWLVASFLMQKHELHQNTQALIEQVDETRTLAEESAEQTKALKVQNKISEEAFQRNKNLQEESSRASLIFDAAVTQAHSIYTLSVKLTSVSSSISNLVVESFDQKECGDPIKTVHPKLVERSLIIFRKDLGKDKEYNLDDLLVILELSYMTVLHEYVSRNYKLTFDTHFIPSSHGGGTRVVTVKSEPFLGCRD